MKIKFFNSYLDYRDIDICYESGYVLASAKFNADEGDAIVTVSNNKENNSIEGAITRYDYKASNTVAKRVYINRSNQDKRSTKKAFAGKQISRFSISDKQFNAIHGGKVKKTCQAMIKTYIEENNLLCA